ncbi:MAG TPA: hypothetical protein VE871_00175, partial [Longimicrobium sp.]|nr:hypothetical protein [Longimicrobium sp.]
MRILSTAACALLLAACSERPAADPPAKTDATPGAALTAAPSAAPPEADLPDFGDVRRFLDMDSMRWAEWDRSAPGDRAARLAALGITLIRSDSTGPREPVDASGGGDEYDPYGENPRHFHFVDFSGDGVADVIYSGPWFERNENGFGALEGRQIKLFQVMEGRGVQVMRHHGTVQRIFRGRAGQPVSFRAIHHGCCADPQWSIDYYRPVRTGDTVRYEAHQKVLGREGIEIPTAFMPTPRRFTVNNDRYLLRATPGIDPPAKDGEDWYPWEGHGNALAEYGRGARGIALAERTDATGRVWWFVR